jgi:uncharacterized phage protein gp47/JayE
MTDQLTATGLEIDDLQTRTAAIKIAIRNAIGANLDLSPDQPDGQLVHIIAETIQATLEVLQDVYTTLDRDEASGDALTQNAALTGTPRRAATAGTVELTLTLDAATTVPAGSIASVAGDPTNRWITDTEVTSVGAGDYTVAATNEETGPIQALANTITVIVTPVVGWTAVDNVSDATEGLAIETDTELRLRADLEVTGSGSTSTDAITAALSTLAAGLGTSISVKTYENTAIISVDSRPPKSVECILHGSDPPLTDAVLAETIYETKAGGIQAWGTTITSHDDDAGISHEIGFSRAVEIPIEIQCNVETDPNLYPGDTAVENALLAYVNGLSVSDEVIYTKIISAIVNVAGVQDATVQIRATGDLWGETNITINIRQIATLDVGDITIT